METLQDKYLADKATLLNIFPEELWLDIFDTAQDPEILQNCYESSEYFTELLESRKPVFLFPQILKVLDQQKRLAIDNLPNFFNCRRVCQIWKASIDQLLETRPYHRKFSDVKIYRAGTFLRRVQVEARHKFHDDPAFPTWFKMYKHKVDKLENEILPRLQCSAFRNRCPTPSRHMDIFECRPRERWHVIANVDKNILERYRAVTVKILEAVGTQFWHARIHITILLSLTEWYTLVRKYVELMPNLKTLYIMPPQINYRGTEYQALENIIDKLSFPHLKNLELISLERFPVFVTNAMLAANNHVKTIEIRDSYAFSSGLKFTKSCYPRNFNISVKTCRELAEIPEYWELERLKLDVDEDFGERITWDKIFRKLECYKSTLVELQLYLPLYEWPTGQNPNQDASRFKLDLPNVKRLKVRVDKNCFIDFVVGLGAVEYLRILGNWKRGSCIDLDDYFLGNVKNSNIWTRLPKLTQLDIKLTEAAKQKLSFRR